MKYQETYRAYLTGQIARCTEEIQNGVTSLADETPMEARRAAYRDALGNFANWIAIERMEEHRASLGIQEKVSGQDE